jgi:hypothetical protein
MNSSRLQHSAISRIWRAFALKPHVVETWKLPPDPQFIEIPDIRRRRSQLPGWVITVGLVLQPL